MQKRAALLGEGAGGEDWDGTRPRCSRLRPGQRGYSAGWERWCTERSCKEQEGWTAATATAASTAAPTTAPAPATAAAAPTAAATTPPAADEEPAARGGRGAIPVDYFVLVEERLKRFGGKKTPRDATGDGFLFVP